MNDEKRGSARYEVVANVQVARESSHRLVNISMGGLCLQTNNELEEIGATIDLTVHFLSPSGTIVTKGEVVWTNSGQKLLGVRFLELSQEDVRILRRYVAPKD